MKNLPKFFVMFSLLVLSKGAAQDRAKIKMPERVFISKIQGKWKAKRVSVLGVFHPSIFQMEIDVEGIQFVRATLSGSKSKRHLKYEKFDLEKNTSDLVFKTGKSIFRYSLKLKENKLHVNLQSEKGELAWVFERDEQKAKAKSKKKKYGN